MDKKAIELLEDIKKLLILQLVKGFKVSSNEVGEVLGVTGRTVRNVATTSKRPRKPKAEKK
jgi:hypothetical protein